MSLAGAMEVGIVVLLLTADQHDKYCVCSIHVTWMYVVMLVFLISCLSVLCGKTC